MTENQPRWQALPIYHVNINVWCNDKNQQTPDDKWIYLTCRNGILCRCVWVIVTNQPAIEGRVACRKHQPKIDFFSKINVKPRVCHWHWWNINLSKLSCRTRIGCACLPTVSYEASKVIVINQLAVIQFERLTGLLGAAGFSNRVLHAV